MSSDRPSFARRVGAGRVVLIGAPNRLMATARRQKLAQVIAGLSQISFAYAPQLYIQGQIDPPREVLYLVLRGDARGQVEALMQSLLPVLHSTLPADDFIDALPVFDDHAFLGDVIRTGCVLQVNDEQHHARCLKAAGLRGQALR